MAFYSLERVLKKVLKDCNLPVQNIDAYKVFHRWEEIAGEGLANHARPVRIDERILYVEVDELLSGSPGAIHGSTSWQRSGSQLKKGIFKDIRFF